MTTIRASRSRAQRGPLRSGALAILAATALVVGIVTPLSAPTPAVAADGANFDPGMIISDSVFYNSSAMNAGQVQAFLNEKGASCSANSLPCVKDITLTYPARGADQYCGTLPAATNVKAADLFVAVGIACNINPQVLLVLVEKEQSLVSRSSPSDYSYRYATGFACPDSGGCDDALSGFVTQVYLAAKQYNRYKINPGSYNYQAGRVNNILYNPNPGCGASGVYIRNQATAGLYNYTPYQPNAAALANLYGTGDGCSSYGNRNFWRMFTDWFGSDTNMLSASSFEGGDVRGWGWANGQPARLAIQSSDSKSGNWFLSMYAFASGQSLVQDVGLNVQAGDTYTASVWIKSNTPGIPYRGTLALWALGGQAELAAKAFTVGNEWTELVVSLPVQRTGHHAMRFEIYLHSTDALLAVDATSLMKGAGQPSRPTTNLLSPGAEEGLAGWNHRTGSLSATTSTTTPQAGTQAFQLSGSGSFGQDVAVNAGIGDTFTGTVWVRASSETVDGTLALWALGGSAEASAVSFTVGEQWRPIGTTTTITQPGVSSLRLEMYTSTSGAQLFLDEASLSPNLATNPSFETPTVAWNTGITTNVVQQVAGTAELPAVDGTQVGVTSGFTGGSIATDVRRRTAADETYTASLWLRSATPGSSWTGTLALWGLGGQTEAASQPITVPETWTQFTIQLPLSQPVHESLRLELYTGSPNVQLAIDGVVVR